MDKLFPLVKRSQVLRCLYLNCDFVDNLLIDSLVGVCDYPPEIDGQSVLVFQDVPCYQIVLLCGCFVRYGRDFCFYNLVV